MQEQNINDLMVYKTIKATISALLAAGRDPVEVVVAMNALCIDMVSGQLVSAPKQ